MLLEKAVSGCMVGKGQKPRYTVPLFIIGHWVAVEVCADAARLLHDDLRDAKVVGACPVIQEDLSLAFRDGDHPVMCSNGFEGL